MALGPLVFLLIALLVSTPTITATALLAVGVVGSGLSPGLTALLYELWIIFFLAAYLSLKDCSTLLLFRW